MASFDFSLTTAPNETPYDSNNPTRSTELYCNAVHIILEDMDDQGQWFITDGLPSAGYRASLKNYLFDLQEAVFDYAEQAITDHRAEEEISISKPESTSLTAPQLTFIREFDLVGFKGYDSAMKMLWLIYYMWKTETDPLLLKEKLQELLIAWPLQDTTIELADDLGQQFKIYPSWKNADL